MQGPTITNSDRDFINESLTSGYRIDGRRPFDFRSIRVEFGEQMGQVEIQLGETRVLAVVTAKVVPPRPERPTEGFFQFTTEFSPMAGLEFDSGRPSPFQVELGRVIERGLRESRAIDTEALCIVAGEKVWAIRIFIHILDHDGNLIDCASIATILALVHFRRPEVSVVGNEVTIYTLQDRPPVPLSIHHIPISVTFGIFAQGEYFLCDPNYKEESTMEGRMTMTLNVQDEICAIQKAGGTPIAVDKVLECTRIAAVKVHEIYEIINTALNEDIQQLKSQRPSSSATTSATFSKHAKWEEIYKSEQSKPDDDSYSEPMDLSEQTDPVTSSKKHDKGSSKEELFADTSSGLFSGVSSWDDSSAAASDAMDTGYDSEEKPVVLSGESEKSDSVVSETKSAAPSRQDDSSSVAEKKASKTAQQIEGDLSVALKKTTRKKTKKKTNK